MMMYLFAVYIYNIYNSVAYRLCLFDGIPLSGYFDVQYQDKEIGPFILKVYLKKYTIFWENFVKKDFFFFLYFICKTSLVSCFIAFLLFIMPMIWIWG